MEERIDRQTPDNGFETFAQLPLFVISTVGRNLNRLELLRFPPDEDYSPSLMLLEMTKFKGLCLFYTSSPKPTTHIQNSIND